LPAFAASLRSPCIDRHDKKAEMKATVVKSGCARCRDGAAAACSLWRRPLTPATSNLGDHLDSRPVALLDSLDESGHPRFSPQHSRRYNRHRCPFAPTTSTSTKGVLNGEGDGDNVRAKPVGPRLGREGGENRRWACPSRVGAFQCRRLAYGGQARGWPWVNFRHWQDRDSNQS
jgi:hypothetical protein